jgi:BASS family bile acid:Na+ symporter
MRGSFNRPISLPKPRPRENGGNDRATRVVSGLGTAQRNLSAALLIATTSFASDGEVFVMVMLASVVMLVVLLPLAAELGRRTEI